MRAAWPGRSSRACMHRLATAPSSSFGSTSARRAPADGRGREQGSKGRPKSFFEVGRQSVVRRISRMQRSREAALGGDEGRVALHPLRQRLARPMLRRQRRRRLGAGVDLATEDSGDEVRSLRKMAIHGADADAGLLGDFAHGGVHARRRERRLGRLKQSVDVAPGVSPHGPRRAAETFRALAVILQFVARQARLAKRNTVPYLYGIWFRFRQTNAKRRRWPCLPNWRSP